MRISELINFETFEYNWKNIMKYSEFKKLEKCEQNPKWHGEGNALIHTKLVCEEAIKICKGQNWEKNTIFPNLLLTSALFHDIGKITSTHKGKDGKWHAYGHEFEGEKITRYLLWDEGYEFRESVCSLVKYHMFPLQLFETKDFYNKIIEVSTKLSEKACWYLLTLLKRCDVLGSYQEDENSKQSDLVKLSSIEKITKQMNCDLNSFPDFIKNEYKNVDGTHNKINVYVMIGIPGSGKSTQALNLSNDENTVIISRDNIRAELGFCEDGEKVVLTRSKENMVTEMFNKQVIQAIEDNKTVIIDNLNIKRKYRDEYKSLLSNYQINWIYYYVEAPTLNENLTRREGQIKRENFEQIINNFEWPTPDEYSTFIKRISNDKIN